MVQYTSSPKHSLPNSLKKKKISILYPSKGAAKINLFLVYFRTFWVLTIKNIQMLPWSSPPTSIKGLFGHMPWGPSLLPHTTLDGNINVTYIDLGIKVSWSTF